MMTIEHAIKNVDDVVAKARASSLRLIKDSEERFIDSVTGRNVMTTEQAIAIVDEQRELVLDELDEAMKRLRAWLLRGGVDIH
ncbi:hypothetical protein [Bradyrhizobium sp. AUGA SZCCT0182]|uniref:hypothetical protein n=1 Tax=Bradyrhizobium sp. AUGA SZCCT0182 TaxID=2807667 RepID=UPI001BAE443B|nr:hypothetical protein [Bradyrhizobium sp. AUGA SZCCT0182]MBR1231974.1 hypothetical protein [Bradyrhizobium sp. AUGA SZCCT0182]